MKWQPPVFLGFACIFVFISTYLYLGYAFLFNSIVVYISVQQVTDPRFSAVRRHKPL